MLSNQIRTPLLINWNDANAPVLVMDFAIDAIGAGRRDNIVMCYANPRIVIGNMLAHDSPWTDDPRFHQVFSPVASMGARVVPEMASPKLNEGRFGRGNARRPGFALSVTRRWPLLQAAYHCA